MKKIVYPIQAVSRLTGLSIDTLRAWERRYEAIKPGRNERGRVYGEVDVRRLILLREVVEGGHAISKIAALGTKDLERIKERSLSLNGIPAESAKAVRPAASPDLKTLREAIGRFDHLEFDRELNRLAAAVPARSLIHQVVVPLMNDVGDQWYRGDLSIAQEHMASGAMRNLLGSLVRLFTRQKPAGTLLFATPQGERHEFGILCAAMLAGIGGVGVVYLGADLPCAEIIEATLKTQSGILVLGIKAAVSGRDSLRELHQIAESLPSSVELWVGGARSPHAIREIKATRAQYLKDFAVLEARLVRVGARF